MSELIKQLELEKKLNKATEYGYQVFFNRITEGYEMVVLSVWQDAANFSTTIKMNELPSFGRARHKVNEMIKEVKVMEATDGD